MKQNLCVGLIVLIVLANIVIAPLACAENAVQAISSIDYKTIHGEILEIEENRRLPGVMTLKVKDFETSETFDFIADPYRVSIQMSGASKPLSELYPGLKATIIYDDSKSNETPQVVFMKVTNSIGY